MGRRGDSGPSRADKVFRRPRPWVTPTAIHGVPLRGTSVSSLDSSSGSRRELLTRLGRDIPCNLFRVP